MFTLLNQLFSRSTVGKPKILGSLPTLVRAILVPVLFVLGLMAASPRPLSASSIPPGYSTETIQVRFLEGQPAVLTNELEASVATFTPLFSLPQQTLKELRARGEGRGQFENTLGGSEQPVRRLPDLSQWFQITLISGTDAGVFIEKLRGLDNVELVEPAPLPAPPPADTPDFTGNQGYLEAAPGGIDANFSWTVPGGDGSGITIYDVEYSWNQAHEDLTKASGVTLLLGPGDSDNDPFNDNNHGTAVLGELIADNDAKGVTGISWGADIGLAPALTDDLGYNPANAILLAVADGASGDVILIEQQTAVCGLPGCNAATQNDCGPSEWVSSVFDAIQTATANGFVVVEAAGNGNVDLDQAACGDTFDRNVQDSGAIIVGAGGSAGGGADRERLAFSSYGSRVDLQGWGQNVMTTGYGASYTNPDDTDNPNFWYTDTFGGTSSASPIVAGAVANLQGIATQRFGTPLTAFQIRSVLRETGSPQLGDTSENIGPRPDLNAAINLLTTGDLDVFFLVDLSGSFSDDLPNFKAQAPVIISTLTASNPNTRFGLGSYEDYPIAPFGSAAAGDVAYRRDIDLTFDTEAVEAVIAGLFTRSGADSPQSQLPALFQAASGAGQDLSGEGFPGASIAAGQQANFRDGATKLFLLWTDAPFHLPNDPGTIPYPGPSFADTVDAILALDPPKVIGISSGGGGLQDLQAIAAATNALAPAGGVDCDADGVIDVPEGEPLVCSVAPSGEGIGEAIIAIVEAAVGPTSVEIDIKPGSEPNIISCTNPGEMIPVAILTTASFDATTVNHLTVTFEGAREFHMHRGSDDPVRHEKDVDNDGDMDLLFHFRRGSTSLNCDATEATLVGETFDGSAIEGTDSVEFLGRH